MMKLNIRYRVKCANPICDSKMAHGRSISYFSFPKDPARCSVWIKHCGLNVTLTTVIQKRYKLCGKHFETKMFLNDLCNRLQPHAIPTLFSNDTPPSIYRQLVFEDRECSIDHNMPELRSHSFKSNGTIVAPCYFDHNYAAPFNAKFKWFQRPVPDIQKHTSDHTYATWQQEKIAVEFLTQPLESLPEQKSFICKTCSVSYNEKHLLTKHIKVMHCQYVTLQSPPVTCEKCGRKFRLKAQLDKHQCRQPPEEIAALAEVKKQKTEFYNRFCEIIDKERFYKCDLCSYYTTSKGNKLNCFKNHYKIHNTGFDVQCNLCVKTFRTKTAMKNHVDIVHHRLKKYSCSECGKKFALLGTLKTHLLIHKGEKPLVCHQCGKSFRHISKLRVHTRFVHLKEKNHRCQVCHKLYSTASQVKMHMTRHLGVRDYTCQVCFKAYFTKKYLSEHIKSVHNGNSLLCITCGKTYKSKRSLMFHRKTGHGTGTE